MASATRCRAALCAAGAAVAVLAGCAHAPPPLYQWAGYQPMLYEHFKGDGKSPDEQLRVMEALSEKSRARGTALPPGFRAHLGLIYLQLERPDEARRQLEAEKMAFPESTPYMDLLLKRLDAPSKS